MVLPSDGACCLGSGALYKTKITGTLFMSLRQTVLFASMLSAATFHAQAQAQTQTNVSVYGLVDATLEHSNQGLGGVNRVQSGGYNGNRLGFRGTENLGNGLSAIYTLESGFTLDDGVLGQGGRIFGRQAFVGLKGSMGALTIGRQYSPYYLSMVNQDAFQWTMVGALTSLTVTSATGSPGLLLGTWQALGRVDNSVVYDSPVVKGFSTRWMYAPGEVAGDAGASRVLGAGARYLMGPLDLNAAYTSGRDAFDRGAQTAVNAGGSYKFGKAQLFAGFIREKNAQAPSRTTSRPATLRKVFNLGARYATTPASRVIFQVVRLQNRSEGLTVDRDATLVAFGGEYDLSKRTVVYSSIGTVGNQNGSGYSLGSGTYVGSAVAGDARASTVNLGLRHSF
jgi:predicted porin